MQVPDLLGIVSYYTHDDAVGRKQVLKAIKIKPTDKRLVKNLGEAFLFLFYPKLEPQKSELCSLLLVVGCCLLVVGCCLLFVVCCLLFVFGFGC